MNFIKGHFDGKSVILDEPSTLVVGQEVQVVFQPNTEMIKPRRRRFGFAKGMFEMSDDFDEPLDEFAEYR